MQTSPAIARLHALEYQDRLEQAAAHRRVAQTRLSSSAVATIERSHPMSPSALVATVVLLLTDARVQAGLTLALALLAGLLLGPDGAEAGKNLDRGIIVHRGR